MRPGVVPHTAVRRGSFLRGSPWVRPPPRALRWRDEDVQGVAGHSWAIRGAQQTGARWMAPEAIMLQRVATSSRLARRLELARSTHSWAPAFSQPLALAAAMSSIPANSAGRRLDPLRRSTKASSLPSSATARWMPAEPPKMRRLSPEPKSTHPARKRAALRSASRQASSNAWLLKARPRRSRPCWEPAIPSRSTRSDPAGSRSTGTTCARKAKDGLGRYSSAPVEPARLAATHSGWLSS